MGEAKRKAQTLDEIRETHRLAVEAFTPDQKAAMERIVMATMIAQSAGQLMPGAGPRALEMVIRHEAEGHCTAPAMWATGDDGTAGHG